MKNTFFTFIFLISFSGLMAQKNQTDSIPKKYIGINLAGNYYAPNFMSTNKMEIQINASPFFGYKVKNFVFGVGLKYGFQYAEFEDSYSNGNDYYIKSKLNELSISPIIRYYTKNGLFITSSFMLGRGKELQEAPTPFIYPRFPITYDIRKIKSESLGANIGLGYAIEAGKSFLIEPQISYNYINRKIKSRDGSVFYSLFSDFNYGVRINIIFGFGITYRF
jgi:hypothetical protein